MPKNGPTPAALMTKGLSTACVLSYWPSSLGLARFFGAKRKEARGLLVHHSKNLTVFGSVLEASNDEQDVDSDANNVGDNGTGTGFISNAVD